MSSSLLPSYWTESFICEVTYGWAKLASTALPDWTCVRGVILTGAVNDEGLVAGVRMIDDNTAVYLSPRRADSARVTTKFRNTATGAVVISSIVTQSAELLLLVSVSVCFA